MAVPCHPLPPCHSPFWPRPSASARHAPFAALERRLALAVLRSRVQLRRLSAVLGEVPRSHSPPRIHGAGRKMLTKRFFC